MEINFQNRLDVLCKKQKNLLERPNQPIVEDNGIITRYIYPVITANHIPLEWRYDMNPDTNPYCLERIGVNATMNSGAIKWNGKYLLIVRVKAVIGNHFLPLPKVRMV